jgi:hypothetical protein
MTIFLKCYGGLRSRARSRSRMSTGDHGGGDVSGSAVPRSLGSGCIGSVPPGGVSRQHRAIGPPLRRSVEGRGILAFMPTGRAVWLAAIYL